MKTRTTFKWISLAFAALLLLFAGFWGHQILQAAFPEQGMMITAVAGTTMKVEADRLVVEEGSASVTSFSQPLRYFLSIVYLVASGLALYGLTALFREKPQ